MYKTSEKIINYTNVMEKWKVKLVAEGQALSEEKSEEASSRETHSSHFYSL